MSVLIRSLKPAGLAVAALAMLYTFVSAATWTPARNEDVSEGALVALLNDDDVVAAGLVTDTESRTIPGASIVLSLHGGSGETLWRIVRPVSRDGTFGFRRRDLPALQNVYPGLVAVEAPNHLSASIPVLVRIENANPGAGVVAAQITPRRLQLHPVTLNPWLTVVLLLPAFFGLVSAVSHLTEYSKSRRVTYWFAYGAAFMWSAVAFEFALVYVVDGYTLVPLFWPDLIVSSGVMVFAYLGTVIYVAYSVLQRGPGFYYDATDDEKRHIVLTLGGRVLMAPYVALVAWAIFAGTFPALRTGAAAAFFGFFTGLWIKPVMEALNDIGMRFLSADRRQKIVERLARETAAEAPPAQTTSAAVLRPDAALLAVVAEARKELLPKEGVVGVDVGLKVAASDVATVRPSLVVYVYEKKPASAVTDAIPGEFRGFPTDVVALAGRAPAACDTLFPKLSWAKIHDDNRARLSAAMAAPTAGLVAATGVALVVDPDATLFNPVATDQKIFDVLGCYKAVQPVLGDPHDFVAFVIDTASGFRPNNEPIGDYHVPVFCDIDGINYNAPGNPGSYAETSNWGTRALRACSVLSFAPERSLYRYLHELGHSWAAYVTLRVKGSADGAHVLQMSTNAQQGHYHWGEHFDDGRSCMDYDITQWLHEGGNRYRRRYVPDEEFEYCPLDLYLMGLIRPSEVGPIRVLRNLTQTPTPMVYTADLETFSVDDVIAACGARVPEAGRAPTKFSQAIVVVSRQQASGEAYANRIHQWRPQYEAAFHRATQQRASLTTTL